jgi:hypothetical protein
MNDPLSEVSVRGYLQVSLLQIIHSSLLKISGERRECEDYQAPLLQLEAMLNSTSPMLTFVSVIIMSLGVT